MQMIQKSPKRTEQEWMSLINECRSSGLSDRTWCAAHGIPMSTFYNRISYFRKKAHLIPDAAPCVAEPRQQVVALSVVDENPNSRMAEPIEMDDTAGNACVIALSLHGARIEISNHACREVIQNTLLSLQYLC